MINPYGDISLMGATGMSSGDPLWMEDFKHLKVGQFGDAKKSLASGKSGGGSGLSGAGISMAGNMMPNTTLGALGNIGAQTGAGALTGGPAGAAIGGGLAALQSLMGGKEGARGPLPQVPVTQAQMGQIGNIYGGGYG